MISVFVIHVYRVKILKSNSIAAHFFLNLSVISVTSRVNMFIFIWLVIFALDFLFYQSMDAFLLSNCIKIMR